MLAALIADVLERRDSLGNPSSDLYRALVGDDPTRSGVSVTPKTAMRVSAVSACVRLIAGTIGTLPLHAFRERADGSRQRVDGHPDAVTLTDRPNAQWTRQQLVEMLL